MRKAIVCVNGKCVNEVNKKNVNPENLMTTKTEEKKEEKCVSPRGYGDITTKITEHIMDAALLTAAKVNDVVEIVVCKFNQLTVYNWNEFWTDIIGAKPTSPSSYYFRAHKLFEYVVSIEANYVILRINDKPFKKADDIDTCLMDIVRTLSGEYVISHYKENAAEYILKNSKYCGDCDFLYNLETNQTKPIVLEGKNDGSMMLTYKKTIESLRLLLSNFIDETNNHIGDGTTIVKMMENAGFTPDEIVALGYNPECGFPMEIIKRIEGLLQKNMKKEIVSLLLYEEGGLSEFSGRLLKRIKEHCYVSEKSNHEYKDEDLLSETLTFMTELCSIK